MPAVLEVQNHSGPIMNKSQKYITAVHFVNQVLEEASAITAAAVESARLSALVLDIDDLKSQDDGQPWRYFQTLKKSQNGKLSGNSDQVCIMASQMPHQDTETENNPERSSNAVAIVTSTPQKSSDDKMIADCSEHVETNIIGQGDEEFDSQNTSSQNLTITTDMFINHLFDMSEVEKVVIGEDSETPQDDNVAPNDMARQVMTHIMESYVKNAFNIGYENETNEQFNQDSSEEVKVQDAASVMGNSNDIVFFINKDISKKSNSLDQEYKIIEITEDSTLTEYQDPEKNCSNIGESDVAFYEKSYLTLNRDCEQGSDEDHEVVYEHPNENSIMQEVDLSRENAWHNVTISEGSKKEETSKLTAESGVSDFRKSRLSLMNRCRSQGAKFISCLRGWWHRKTPGKRRGSRYVVQTNERKNDPVYGMKKGFGSFIDGYITMSYARANCERHPDGRRRRATSLIEIENCDTSSPSYSNSVTWKFNTINETKVTSSRWNDYTFEKKAEDIELKVRPDEVVN